MYSPRNTQFFCSYIDTRVSGSPIIQDGKVVFAQTHNNTIDLQIIRHKHEFSVEITSDGLYLICDEETDAPKTLRLRSVYDIR